MDYKDENMWLMLGDCLERMKEIPDGSVDAIICDPPYQMTANKWDSVVPFEPMWEQLNRVIKPNGAIVLFGSEPFSSALRMSNIKNYKYDWVWNKKKHANAWMSKFQPLKIHELVHIFSSGGKANYYPIKEKRMPRVDKESNIKNGDNFGGKTVKRKYSNPEGLYNPKSIIEVSNANQRGKVHPTQKPVALMEYLIKTYTNEGETVLDFTAGSFSTGVACVNTNRKFIGVEMDEGYFDIGLKRIKEAMDER